jgi:hypothetical protein
VQNSAACFRTLQKRADVELHRISLVLNQVVYVFGVDAGDVDWEDVDLTLVDMDDPDLFYVIHAMELPKRDRRQYRRRRK